jgi:hypothetical protein
MPSSPPPRSCPPEIPPPRTCRAGAGGSRFTRWIVAGALGLGLARAAVAAADADRICLASPAGTLAAEFMLTPEGAPTYRVRYGQRIVLEDSRLGLQRDDGDFSRRLQLVSASDTEVVQDHYEILTAKRRSNAYRATRKVLHLQDASGRPLDLIFQVSDDGVAFRYRFPNTDATRHQLQAEATSFKLPAGSRAWLQPIAVAQTGYAQTNPSYEEYYEKNIAAGTPSPTGAGWVYPALFRTGDAWLLISESGLGRTYCGTRLGAESPDGEYSIQFADPREVVPGGPALPESTLPWATPWRLIVVGSLRTITESMLGLDLADHPTRPPTDAELDGPGKASWSWPLLGDAHTNLDVQKRFVDYAADMGWRYTLVDAGWDRQIGDQGLCELIGYAASRKVRILLWYNSAGSWNTTTQTPRHRLLTHDARVAEFGRLRSLGIAGVKIDFFGGDGQSMIAYYHDLLEDAAAAGLLVNFHGATLPRGWTRTYPNLMTAEAVRGLEYVTFEQRNADEEPTHAAMLPFTRNVFDPMDFTPMVLDRVSDRIQRRTSGAFELALAVLFTSGIQHYAEMPEGMAKAPEYVRALLRQLPTVWDDMAFLAGEPGEYVVLARRAGNRWYVAGINGSPTNRAITLDLARLGVNGRRATLITDGGGDALQFQHTPVQLSDGTAPVLLRGHGGFVLSFE